MSALAVLQREFQARVLEAGSTIESQLACPDGDVAERLHIYQHAYQTRLVDALGRTYSALRRGLGGESFDELARAFVRATRSRHRSIRDYGAGLGSFLVARDGSDAARAWAELADWQWLLTDVFDAAAAVPLTVASVHSVPPDRWGELHFSLHPTARRFRSTTNAIELWRHLSVDAEGAETSTAGAAAANGRATPAPSAAPPVEWLLWRRELTTSYRSLDGVEALAIDGLRAGASFAELCVRLTATGPEDLAPLRAAQFLRGWIESGLVTGMWS